MPNLTANRTLQTLLKGLLFGVFAAVANLFLSIPIYGALSLSWGMGICIYVMITFGIRASLVTLFFSLASLYLADRPLLDVGIGLLEFLVIALLTHKRCFVVIASLGFWLFIGSPLYWLYLNSFSNVANGEEISFIFSVSQGLNGLFNGSIAAMFFLLTPAKWISDHINSANKSLSSNIFGLSALTLILPLVTVSFMLASTASERNEEQLVKILRAEATSISLATDRFINQHFILINQIARTLTHVSDEQTRQKILVDAQSEYPDFFNITYIQADGFTAYFAPTRYNEELKNLPKNLRFVNDRLYFTHTRDNKTPFISGAMMSRGIISAPMIAMASPILDGNEFKGAILGAMNLQFINTLHENMESNLQSNFVIITDNDNQVIYSSSPIGLNNLDKYTMKIGQSRLIPNFPMLLIEGKNYPYHLAHNSFDWKIFIIKQPDELAKLFSHHLLVLAVTVVTIILLFLFIAHRLAKQITSPLVKLLQNSSDSYISNFENIGGATSSQEINEVAAKLRKSHNLLRDFEDQLQQQVTEKTNQLEQMNLQLAAQAREDGLTQLLNRSGFDEIAYNAIKTNQRLHQPISLALIDIDH
ncbi:MAG: hypothetical protein ACI8VI_000428, partial [Granulosicoccus sp.]